MPPHIYPVWDIVRLVCITLVRFNFTLTRIEKWIFLCLANLYGYLLAPGDKLYPELGLTAPALAMAGGRPDFARSGIKYFYLLDIWTKFWGFN